MMVESTGKRGGAGAEADGGLWLSVDISSLEKRAKVQLQFR